MKKISWLTVSSALLASLGAQSGGKNNLANLPKTIHPELSSPTVTTSKVLNNVNLDEMPELEGGEPCVGSPSSK